MTTTKQRKTLAVLTKQLKDTLKNKMVLIQFVLYPLVALVFTEAVAKNNTANLQPDFFVLIFSALYAGMVPMVNAAAIISEEKEEGTLRSLIMAGVRPWQYLLGVGCYIMLFMLVGALAFGLMAGHSGRALANFILVVVAGSLASLLLGAAVGMLAKNQMSATAIVLPLSMVVGFTPMLAMFNPSIQNAARFLYTQQINLLLAKPLDLFASPLPLAFMAGNTALFALIFFTAYKKGNLAE